MQDSLEPSSIQLHVETGALTETMPRSLVTVLSHET